MAWLRNFLEEKLADVNPWDNGRTGATVRQERSRPRPAATPPPSPARPSTPQRTNAVQDFFVKGNDNRNFLNNSIDLGKYFASGMQQVGGNVADAALMGGAVVGDTKIALNPFLSPEEKQRQQMQNYQTTEMLRNKIKSAKTVTGESFNPRADFQFTGDWKRDTANLAGRSLSVGLDATTFINPAGGALKSMTGNQAIKQTLKQTAKEAPFYGGLTGVSQASETYGQTGDAGLALRTGAKSGLAAAGMQAGFMVGGHAVGAGGRYAARQAQTIPGRTKGQLMDMASAEAPVVNARLDFIQDSGKQLDPRRVKLYEKELLNSRQTKPIVVTPDENGILQVVDGDHRLAAYRNLGVDSIPTKTVSPSQLDQAIGAYREMNKVASRRLVPGGTLGGPLATGYDSAMKRGRVFDGVDGKPRFEIDDSNARLVARGDAADTLDKLLDHPTLFENYPHLKDTLVDIKIDKNYKGDNKGYYDPETDSISVTAKNHADAKKTLIHEIQHAIQEKEGFAKGGSDDAFKNPSGTDLKGSMIADELRSALKLIDEAGGNYKALQDNPYKWLSDDAKNMLRRMDRKTLDANIKSFKSNAKTPFENYRRLAGEAEARAVAERRNMPDSERYVEQQGDSQKLYHGTDAEFDRFDIGKSGSRNPLDKGEFGKGIYLTPDKNIASKYGKNVKEVIADLRKPFEIDSNSREANIAAKNDLIKIINKTTGENIELDYQGSGKQVSDFIYDYGPDRVSEILRKNGYDGVVVKNKDYPEVVVFDDKAIKNHSRKDTKMVSNFPRSTFYDSLDVPKDELIVRQGDGGRVNNGGSPKAEFMETMRTQLKGTSAEGGESVWNGSKFERKTVPANSLIGETPDSPARVAEWKGRISKGERPSVLTVDGKVVDGQHKLQAYKELGIPEIPIINAATPAVRTGKINPFSPELDAKWAAINAKKRAGNSRMMSIDPEYKPDELDTRKFKSADEFVRHYEANSDAIPQSKEYKEFTSKLKTVKSELDELQTRLGSSDQMSGADLNRNNALGAEYRRLLDNAPDSPIRTQAGTKYLREDLEKFYNQSQSSPVKKPLPKPEPEYKPSKAVREAERDFIAGRISTTQLENIRQADAKMAKAKPKEVLPQAQNQKPSIAKSQKSEDISSTSQLNTERIGLTNEAKTRLNKETNEVIGRLSNKEVKEFAKAAGMDMNNYDANRTRKKIAEQLNLRNEISTIETQIAKAKKSGASTAEIATLMEKSAELGRTSRTQGTDLGRQLQARRIIADQLATPQQKLFRLLDEAGVEPEVYTKRLADVDMNNADDVIKAYRDLVPAKFGDWLDKYRYTNMLSSPLTHIVNITSNLSGLAGVAPIEKLYGGAVDATRAALTRKGRTRYAGEAGAYYKGVAQSFPDAVKNFKDVMTGKKMMETPDVDTLKYSKLATGGVKGAADTVLSFVPKLLEASDQLGMTVSRGGEMAALEYRGKKGVSLPKDLAGAADDAAKYRVFRQELGAEGQGHLLGAVDAIPQAILTMRRSKNPAVRNIAKFTIPFVTTPVNLFKQGIEYSPAGILTLAGHSDKTGQAAKAVMGTTIMGLAAGALASKDAITFSEPTDSKQRDAFRAEGKQPYAIKVGDKWIGYSKLHPAISFNLAAVGAAKEAFDKGAIDQSGMDKALAMFGGVMGYYRDQSFMKSVGDFTANLEMKDGGDFEAAVVSTASNWSNQLVPFKSMVSWVGRQVDPTQRKTDYKASPLDQYWQNLVRDIPGLNEAVPVRENPYYKNSVEPITNDNPTLNAFSPLRITNDKGYGNTTGLNVTERREMAELPDEEREAFRQAAINEKYAKKQKEAEGSASNGGDIEINGSIPDNYKSTLSDYDEMTEEEQDSWFNEVPSAEYEYKQAKYENDKANGKLSKAEDLKARKEVAKAKVGKDYPKEIRELYGLSKSDFYDLITSDPDGNRIAEQALKYGDALEAAGLDDNKFRLKNGSVSFGNARRSGGGGGRKRKASSSSNGLDYTKLFAFSDPTATAKSLRQLLAEAMVK